MTFYYTNYVYCVNIIFFSKLVDVFKSEVVYNIYLSSLSRQAQSIQAPRSRQAPSTHNLVKPVQLFTDWRRTDRSIVLPRIYIKK